MHGGWVKRNHFYRDVWGIKIQEVNDELTGLPLDHQQVFEGMKMVIKIETWKVGT